MAIVTPIINIAAIAAPTAPVRAAAHPVLLSQRGGKRKGKKEKEEKKEREGGRKR